MDKAKEAVKSFIGKSGHHDTEVNEHVQPAVTEEHIKPHRHEETTSAIDREVHQDHYHTTVQPLEHREVLPEKHSHQSLPVEEREVHHGDSSRIKEGVQAEAAKFSSSSTTHGTTHSQAEAPSVAGEHVHHHVHETVQPVINKETVQPEVVHTTRPIHETHHAQAEHHGMSVLPTKTLDEFKSVGGQAAGGSHRHEEYEGHPRPYNPEMQAGRSVADRNPAAHDGLHDSHPTSGTNLTGTTGHTGHHGHHTGSAAAGTTGGLTGASSGLGSNTHSTGTTGTTGGLTGASSGLGSNTHSTGTTGATGTTGGLTGTSGQNVSGSGHSYNTGTNYTTGGGATSTGTALGGRTEGNTVGRAVDAATGHSSGVEHSHTGTGAGVGAAAAGASGLGGSHTGTSSVGTEGTSGRGLEHSTTGHSSTGGTATLPDRGHTDTSSSTNTGVGRNVGTGATHTDTGKDVPDDGNQHASQGKDPNLVENSGDGNKLKGEGVDGSHSAVFGLTPDGHKFDDTSHGHGSLKPAHSKETSNTATEDLGSRKSTSSAVAGQMHDPKVAEKGHGGSSMTSGGSAKPGAGSGLAGQQGFGEVRPQEHGTESKIKDKLDPTTDADNDGKRGVGD